MGYRILGWAVWNSVKWYLKGRYGSSGSRRALALGVLGVVGVAAAALAVGGARRASSSSS
jgi:hypothetical protein